MVSVAEEWRPVVGRFAGWDYEVSDQGRVRSLHKRRSRGSADGILTHYGNNVGYRLVMLSKNGISKNATVHSLVAETFIHPRIGKEEVNHLDGNKQNNVAANLEWVTKPENANHAIRTGIRRVFSGGSSKGESNPRSRLTDSQVKEIITAFRSKEPRKAIAARYGISVGSVEEIGARKSWKHIEA